MDTEFHPPRRKGILFQGGLILALTAAGAYFFFLATQDPSGLGFLLNMLIALVILSPLPLLIYRFYALFNAMYKLRRDGLRIQWGLRHEDIPLGTIEWMRPANELGFWLPTPWLKWPGAILGTRRVPELGLVEFIASDRAHMILVATPEKIYAVSPMKANAFLAYFQQINELGSLTPLEAQSVYPQVLIGRVWEDRLARLLVLLGFGVGLVLLATVAFTVPGLETVAWTGFGDDAPAERLLLLPVLDGLIWITNLIFGTLLYRQGSNYRIAAYILWGNGVLIAALLLVGSLIIIY
ncbi:MAG: PH domain-containing protein [Chloroflexota bacterium]|nr:PH domain-containing protein [Chloroflexota bacterium]